MPEPTRPNSDAPFLESATRISFMGGLNSQVVDGKWDHFRERFHDFDPDKVASFTPDVLEDLGQDEGLIRNARKLSATVENAETMTDIADEHGSFHEWVAELYDERGADGASKELSKRFKYISEKGAHFWLWSMGYDIGDFGEDSRAKYSLPER